MKIFKDMQEFKHEQLVFVHDKHTGLKGIICIHDTTLGPALGGTRIWNYETEEEAISDVLRLARGMTYKNAAAGLNLGGGKAVIIGDASKIKSEALFRSFGRFVESLNGRYITAEDVNTSTKDMDFINMETNNVVGLEGKSGDPSPITSLGAFYGLKAALQYRFKNEDISKYSYSVQGVGKTGMYMLQYLFEEGAEKVYFTDISKEKIAEVNKRFPKAVFVESSEIYTQDVDVFIPCALGGGLNDETIPKLKCEIVAGVANNVLKDENKHSKMLKDRNILYAPDYVINAGGVINVYHELGGYDFEAAKADVKKIYDRLLEIFKIADEQNIDTQHAANVFAENRIKLIHNIRGNYLGK